MRAVVVYYSRTGNTKIAAEAIAKGLGCDIEEILDQKKRKGLVGTAGAYLNPKAETTIQEMRHDPMDYDVVIVGTPIWWYTVTPAVIAFLKKYKGQLKKAAFFYTCDADAKIKAFEDMQEHVGMAPASTLALESGAIKEGTFNGALSAFIDALK